MAKRSTKTKVAAPKNANATFTEMDIRHTLLGMVSQHFMTMSMADLICDRFEIEKCSDGLVRLMNLAKESAAK